MRYRIIEECDSNGKVWNYEIQARWMFIWLPVGDARTLEYARDTVAKLKGSTKSVVPNQ
jgi:hypothetical protein